MSTSCKQRPSTPSQRGWRAGIGFWPATLTSFVLLMLILITPSTGVAAGSSKPALPPGGHDVTQPWVVKPVASTPPSNFSSLGGTLISSPAVASWAQNRMDVFALGGDKALWYTSWDGTNWTGWRSLGGRFNSAPAAVSWGPNRIDLFSRGEDFALWHSAFDGTTWTGWQSLGGRFNSAPAVASWSSNRLDLFGYGTDNGLYHSAWDGLQWEAWEGLGGLLTSDPGAVSWSANRIDIFGRGVDGQLWHKYWYAAAWYGWTREMGAGYPAGLATIGLTSGPAVASKYNSLLDVVVVGTDSALWHMPWNGVAWQGWYSIGGWWQYGPAAISRSGAGNTDIFAVAADGAVWHAQI